MLLLAAIILVIWLVVVALRSAIGTAVGGLIFCGVLIAALGWPVAVIATLAAAVKLWPRQQRTA